MKSRRRVAVLVAVVLTAATLLALSVGLAGCGGKLPGDAVAKVGGTVITKKQLDAKVAEFETQLSPYVPDKETDPEGYKSFQQDVLEYMITYELARQKAGSLRVSVTDEDVQSEIDAIINDSFNGDQAAFESALADQNLTLEKFKEGYKESLLLQKTYEAVTKNITSVSDEEIAAYYEQNKDYYFVEETRTARHILIAPVPGRVDGTTTTTSSTTTTASESTDTGESESPTVTSATTSTTVKPTESDWAAALATAEQVRAQLLAGGDWTELAQKYSDDPGTKNRGGDLGTVYKGETAPEFDEAVFSLAKDEISQPVKTVYGYHIIQVTGINEAKQYSLEEVKEDITNILLNDKKARAWKDWVDKTKLEIGVIYADDWQPTTTTTSAPAPSDATTTTGTPAVSDATTTTAAGPTTTVGSSDTTADAPEDTAVVIPTPGTD